MPPDSNHHNLSRLVEGEWPQENAIDQVENSCIRTRPDCQAEQCGQRPGRLRQESAAALADFRCQ
jgi:hypothetical protein